MSWSEQRCHRVIRPLKAQINRYLAYVKAEPSSIEIELPDNTPLTFHLLRAQPAHTYGRRKRDASKLALLASTRMLHNLKGLLSEDHYEQLTALFSVIEQFISHCVSPLRALSERSAYKLGCTMASECDTIEEEVEWHSSIDIFGDRFRKQLTLGHGIGLICRSSESLGPLLPVVVQHCIDINNNFLASQFLASFIEAMAEIDQISFYFDTLVHFSAQLNTNIDTLILKAQYSGPVTEITQNLTGLLSKSSNCSTNALNCVITSTAQRLKQTKDSAVHDCLFQLLKVYFRHCEWSPSVQFIQRIYRILSPREEMSLLLRKSLLIYLSMARRENMINLEAETGHRRTTIQQNIISLFDDPCHFKALCEHFILQHPDFVTELSHAFLERHCDLSLVTWQDELTSQVFSSTTDDEYEYDKVLGVWVSNSSNNGTSASDSDSDSEGSIATFADDEEDDVSLISVHTKRSLRNGLIRPMKKIKLWSESEDEDDISLIIT